MQNKIFIFLTTKNFVGYIPSFKLTPLLLFLFHFPLIIVRKIFPFFYSNLYFKSRPESVKRVTHKIVHCLFRPVIITIFWF